MVLLITSRNSLRRDSGRVAGFHGSSRDSPARTSATRNCIFSRERARAWCVMMILIAYLGLPAVSKNDCLVTYIHVLATERRMYAYMDVRIRLHSCRMYAHTYPSAPYPAPVTSSGVVAQQWACLWPRCLSLTAPVHTRARPSVTLTHRPSPVLPASLLCIFGIRSL